MNEGIMFDATCITPECLTDRLQKNGHLPEGVVENIRIVKTFGSSAVSFLYLEVTYSDDAEEEAPPHLFFKVFLEKSWKISGMRELVFYRDLNPEMPDSPAVRCYDTGIDPDASYCYLLLQDLSKTHFQGLDEERIDQFDYMVDRMARVHGYWWHHPRIEEADFDTPVVGPLRMVHATSADILHTYCEPLERALEAYWGKFQEKLSKTWLRRCERIVTQWPDLFCARIADAESLTLIHGDFGPGNMYRPRNPEIHDFCVIDWETCKRSIGPYDLTGHLIGGGGIEGEYRRRVEMRLLKRYHKALLDQGITNYDWEACLEDYRLSIMAFAFPPILLGGSINFFRAVMRAFEDWDCDVLLR